ncbi:DUF2442 domain-containing protein [Spirosoma gilvum]
MRNVGFNSTIPEIVRVSFRKEGAITLYLEDGRTLFAPLNRFPGISKLTVEQRKLYHISDGAFLMFQGDDEIYHIQDFLGTFETNSYHSLNKQIQIDFLAAFRQLLISLGTAENLPVNEQLFIRLTDYWEHTHNIPPTVLFKGIPIETIVTRLQKSDRRLRFPNEFIAGEIRSEQGLTGFSAKFREQGWIILPAELSTTYKNLFLNILVASIGLEYLYPSRRELLTEAEHVALEAMVPEVEIRKFFGVNLTRYPDSFRNEVANYFNIPFDYLLKRANYLGLVREADNSIAQKLSVPRKLAGKRAA